MNDLKKDLLAIVEEKDSVSDDDFERILYSHDLVSLPKLLGTLYQTVPDIVVRPKTTDQVAKIVNYANEKKLPIITKGASTSPTGASVPINGGLVLDISAMNAGLDLDNETSTVQVEPGVVWDYLERQLNESGYTLNVYPTSAPSSTVGGWVAGSGLGYGIGGVGVGSSKYGAISDNIVSLEVVLPTGEVKNIPSQVYEVNDFVGTDGILGILTRIRLNVRKMPEVLKSYAFTFESAEDLCSSIEEVSKSMDVYFSEFEDRQLHEMKNQADIPTHGSANVVFFTLEGDKENVQADQQKIMAIVKDKNGDYLGDEAGQEAWEERFNPIRIKRAGPSLMSSEINVHTSKLHDALDGISRIGRDFKVTVGIQGILVKDGVNIIPIVLNDERKGLDYTLSTSITQAFNALALKLQGKPYGVGLFNAFYSKEIHGERFEKLKKMKKELDPRNIMNPGKSINHMTKFGVPLPKMVYSITMKSFGFLKKLGIGG
jgi:glycolate oxidase